MMTRKEMQLKRVGDIEAALREVRFAVTNGDSKEVVDWSLTVSVRLNNLVAGCMTEIRNM